MEFQDIGHALAWLGRQTGRPVTARLTGPLLHDYLEVHGVGSDLTGAVVITDRPERLIHELEFIRRARSGE